MEQKMKKHLLWAGQNCQTRHLSLLGGHGSDELQAASPLRLISRLEADNENELLALRPHGSLFTCSHAFCGMKLVECSSSKDLYRGYWVL